VDAELEDWKSRGQYFDNLGFDVFYRRVGSGPRLLLIHGYPFNSWDWAPIWPTLTKRFTVIAPDMLGMGFSDKPVRYEYSVPDHADMHEALLAHLGVESCHIVAHDIGVSVAQEMLTRHDGGQQSHGRFGIDSVTWLNGGLFNEAYAPRLVQTLLSRTPLGELAAGCRTFCCHGEYSSVRSMSCSDRIRSRPRACTSCSTRSSSSTTASG
jgi:hypothetical protein